MCLLIASAMYFAAYTFFMNGFLIQASISGVMATLIISYFSYRTIKNHRCIFGKQKDCNK